MTKKVYAICYDVIDIDNMYFDVPPQPAAGESHYLNIKDYSGER